MEVRALVHHNAGLAFLRDVEDRWCCLFFRHSSKFSSRRVETVSVVGNGRTVKGKSVN
jgi:hypothetical protein